MNYSLSLSTNKSELLNLKHKPTNNKKQSSVKENKQIYKGNKKVMSK
jgi:hypothetical protein